MTAIASPDGRFLGGISPGGYSWHCNLCGWGKKTSISKPFPTEEKAHKDFTRHLRVKHAETLATPLPQIGRRVGRERVVR